jgi:hypothetical protein
VAGWEKYEKRACWLRRRSFCCLLMLAGDPVSGSGCSASPRQALSVGSRRRACPLCRASRKTRIASRESRVQTQSQSEVATYPDSPEPNPSQAADQSGQSATSQSGSEYQQDSAPKPVGTAAAPYEKTTGVAASRPAGAVIAPAKQRRARSILIRVGVIVGAAVAIGTVVALSRASPSRPN